MTQRDTNVSVAVDELEKRKLEALAEAHDSSQASTIRHWIEERYFEVFGDVHPDALERSDVDTDRMVRGAVDPESVDDELKMDGDRPAKVPASDGGVSAPVQPSSYTPTHTPSDLAKSGPALSWDELKDAVDRHWGDGLEIHPDRVDHNDETLKANLAVASKIITAILRSRGDIVDGEQIDATILRYTGHQIRRADDDAGMAYKRSQYRPLILEHFTPHPDPCTDEYYTSEAAIHEQLPEDVHGAIDDLQTMERFVVDPKDHAQHTGVDPRENADGWLTDLSEFRQALGLLHNVRERDILTDVLHEFDDDVFGEYPSMIVAVSKVFNQQFRKYRSVNKYARFAIADAVLDLGGEQLLEVEDYDAGDEVRTVNPDHPRSVAIEWIGQRETPLSPQAQIDAVAEKIR